MKYIQSCITLLCLAWATVSCEEFLDQKPNKSLLVPESVSEFEAMIDNYDRINLTPVLPFIYADDYWTTPSNWNNFDPWVQNAYKWSMDPYLPGDIPLDFTILYRKIFTANVLLDKISENPDWKQEEINRLKAKALFWRAHGYFELAVLFLPVPYVSEKSGDYKIPFRNTGALGGTVQWKTAEEIFPLILADLEESVSLLPNKPQYPTQPSRYSGHALLARIQLYLGDFENARIQGEQVLLGDFSMIDYPQLDMQAPFPVSIFNSETVFFSNMAPQSTVSGNNVAFVDPNLLASYSPDDLRAGFLVRNAGGNTYFKGSYISKQDVFTGVALDEILLILAESNSRLGSIAEGLRYLNELMKFRVKDFVCLETEVDAEALEWIIDARRKSLMFRGQRWADLKRLNVFDSEPSVLTREVNGQVVSVTLSPENLVAKIPQREIELK